MEGFDYIIKRLPPARICFGSSLTRQTLPPQSKFQSPLMRRVNNEYNSLKAPIFNPDDQSPCHCPAISPNGYGPLASRTPRFVFDQSAIVKMSKKIRRGSTTTSMSLASSRHSHPGVAMSKVQQPVETAVVRQCWQPFGRSLHERDISSTTPG